FIYIYTPSPVELPFDVSIIIIDPSGSYFRTHHLYTLACALNAPKTTHFHYISMEMYSLFTLEPYIKSVILIYLRLIDFCINFQKTIQLQKLNETWFHPDGAPFD